MENLFPQRLAGRLGPLSIVTRSRRLGHHKGTHRSLKTGMSLDFSDFREYHPGDDLRHIDWNVFARTEKPFIKQFLDEQEMRIHILLDGTKSMEPDGKWDFARQLAIGLGLVALKSGDTVSFSSRGEEADHFIRRKGTLHRAAFTAYIAGIGKPSSKTDFTDRAFQLIPKAVTVLFIITDGLEKAEKWEHLFRRLPGVCKDIRVIVVEGAEETDPLYAGDLRLIDIETGGSVEVSMTNRVREDYANSKAAHDALLQSLSRKYGIWLMRARVTDGVLDTISKRMRLAGWVK